MGKSSRSQAVLKRQEVIDSLGRRNHGVRWNAFSSPLHSIHIWGALLFSLIAIMPMGWGVHPMPYRLGETALKDIASRVEFEWSDPEEEARELREVERDFARIYRQDAEWDWTPKVSTAIWNLIEQADGVGDPQKLLEYAKSKEIEITMKQAETMVSTLQGEKDRIIPFRDIVVPLQNVLQESVFARGLLSKERFREELGHYIRIVNQDDNSRRVLVSRNSSSSPIEPAQLAPILDQGFAHMRVNLEFRTTLREILLLRITPNLSYEQEGSAQALKDLKASVIRRSKKVNRGDIILGQGEQVTLPLMRKLREEEEIYRAAEGWIQLVRKLGGKLVLIFAISLLFLSSIGKPGGEVPAWAGAVAGILALVVSSVSYVTVYYGIPATVIPLVFFAGLSGLLMGRGASMLGTLCLSLMTLVIVEAQFGAILAGAAGGLCMIILLWHIRYALGYITAALVAGLVSVAVMFAWGYAAGEAVNFESASAALAVGSLLRRASYFVPVCFASGVMIMLLRPGLERVFGITTDVRLHELQDQDQPLLKKLVLEAPGSYHHSVIVGTLAETAAEAVGANPLLAKVGSYYHDIGKLIKPEYFTENESGISRHDNLNPSMSALIIMAHVKDGAEMAREYGLPPRIIDIIEQHHGQTMVSFFYHRANRQAVNGEKISKLPYLYPGPIPQSKEAAIVMIADSVEAATRSLGKPTPAHISKLVHDLTVGKLMARQLDNSGLTLSDLDKIENSFVRVLNSMFHSRVKYPGQEESSRKRR